MMDSSSTPMPSMGSMQSPDSTETDADQGSESSEFHSSDPNLTDGLQEGDEINVTATLKVSAITDDGADFEVSKIERTGGGPQRMNEGPSAKDAMDQYLGPGTPASSA